MKKGVRTVLVVLLVSVLLFGTGNLVFWFIQSEENMQAGQEARELIDIPDPDPPLAELPEPSSGPSVSMPSSEPAEEQTLLPSHDPGEGEPPVPVFHDPVANSLLQTELEALQEVNPDVAGWIVIPDTPISYPLLQGEDNEYYLKHSWQKKRNSGGSIFMECRSSDDFSDFNTIIYGHRMRDTSMFNGLQYYEDQEYLAQHPRIYIVTNAEVLVYEIFASGKVTVTDPVYWLITDQERYKQPMIDFCLENSAVDTGIRPTPADRLLTLSTCTSVRGSDYRWVVVAVQVGAVARGTTET